MSTARDTIPDLVDLVPADLHMSTADRLRLVADVIEKHPERHYQGLFQTNGDGVDIADGGGVTACGTTFCVAGWATVLTPKSGIDPGAMWTIRGLTAYNHSVIGRASLGLADDLAGLVFFTAMFDVDRPQLVRGLHALADLPEPRTLREAVTAGIAVEIPDSGADLNDPKCLDDAADFWEFA